MSAVSFSNEFSVLRSTVLGHIAGEAPGIVTFDNVPGRAVVDLLKRSDNAWLRRQVSADNGTYRFMGLPMGVLYDVIGRDMTDEWGDVIVGRVSPFAPIQISGNAQSFLIGQAYSYQYVLTGGEQPFTFTLVGDLPDGLTIVTTSTTVGIEGAATVSAVASAFRIDVEDSRGATASIEDVIAEGDPYRANVVALLNFPGSDGSRIFTDETGRAWEFSGDAQIDTSLGYNTGLFDGVSDYIVTPHDSRLQLSGGDFTIETFIYPTAGGYYRGIIGKRAGPPAAEWQVFLNNGDNKVGFYNGTVYLSTTQVSLNTLKHIAVTLSGTTLRIFINGVLDATHTGVTIANGTAPLYVGTSTIGLGSTEWYTGHIRAMRVTKGIARYTSNFTPPSVPFKY